MEDARKQRSRTGAATYWRLDFATEILIYGVLIFTPWAFGATERWAIKSVNTWNYILGGLLVAKWVVRLATGFKPERWDGPESLRGVKPRWILGPLAFLTVFILAYTAFSAFNARANFIQDEQRFDYFEAYNKNLPHSYDQSGTWAAFRLYLAVACFFWALRDWLSTKTRRESRTDIDQEGIAAIGPELNEVSGGYYSYDPTRFPSRLKRLLWVICINGALLSVQGTLQRLSGSNELLWSVRPQFNQYSWQQFGPFNYRSNAAQYLNMIWPVCLAFWWALNQQRRKKFGEGSEFLLLVFTGLMVAAPLLASSRGGILIAGAQILGIIGVFAYSFRKTGWRKTALVSILFLVIVAAGLALSWNSRNGIKSRLNENIFESFGGRKEIYVNARKIVEDFPVWGTGPGTFIAVYQLYRDDPLQTWYATAHDDFLETMVTFGRFGLTIILFALVTILGYWFLARGIPTSKLFIAFIWIATAGCLLHAKFDFPLQVYSILLLFVTNCAILTTLARRS